MGIIGCYCMIIIFKGFYTFSSNRFYLIFMEKALAISKGSRPFHVVYIFDIFHKLYYVYSNKTVDMNYFLVRFAKVK